MRAIRRNDKVQSKAGRIGLVIQTISHRGLFRVQWEPELTKTGKKKAKQRAEITYDPASNLIYIGQGYESKEREAAVTKARKELVKHLQAATIRGRAN